MDERIYDKTLILILFIIIIVISFYFVNYKQQPIIIQAPSSQAPYTRDIIRNRDYRTVYDPLMPPEKRLDSYLYPNKITDPIFGMVDIPTRGYPDGYQYYGLLTRNSDNSKVKLFGRQRYPSSTQYEYYGILDDSGSSFKVSINNKNYKELYDGDEVIIDMLDSTKGPFKLYMNKQAELQYNPHILTS